MDNNIQDVNFEEIGKEEHKNIRGRVLYYSTSQVADVLGTSDSKIRYYTSVFDDILHIEISNKQRRYTEKDIEKLKFIIELKNQGMTIKQIQEYCEEVDFENENGIQIKETNPLSIQTLAKALMEEQHKQMMEFKNEVLEAVSIQLNNQISLIKEHNENIKNDIIENVSITVDGVIDDRLGDLTESQKAQLEEYKRENAELNGIIKDTIKSEIDNGMITQTESIMEYINVQEKQATEKIDKLLENMEERKKQYEEEQLQKEKKKGIFRWFKN
jgi:DNA-binding transcriptional MerR regulator